MGTVQGTARSTYLDPFDPGHCKAHDASLLSPRIVAVKQLDVKRPTRGCVPVDASQKSHFRKRRRSV